MKHIPASWPGAGFKRFAIQHKKKVQDLIDGLHNRLQLAIANGTAEPCMVTRSMEKAAQATGVVSAAEEQLIKCNAMLSYAGECRKDYRTGSSSLTCSPPSWYRYLRLCPCQLLPLHVHVP